MATVFERFHFNVGLLGGSPELQPETCLIRASKSHVEALKHQRLQGVADVCFNGGADGDSHPCFCPEICTPQRAIQKRPAKAKPGPGEQEVVKPHFVHFQQQIVLALAMPPVTVGTGGMKDIAATRAVSRKWALSSFPSVQDNMSGGSVQPQGRENRQAQPRMPQQRKTLKAVRKRLLQPPQAPGLQEHHGSSYSPAQATEAVSGPLGHVWMGRGTRHQDFPGLASVPCPASCGLMGTPAPRRTRR